MTAVFLALLQAGIVPEISKFIKDRYTKTGKFPTEAEIVARVKLKGEGIVSRGEAFLLENLPK